MDTNILSEKEIHYLQLIEKGDLQYSILMPPEVNLLISKGLIDNVTTLNFPNPSTTHHYQLTVYGKYMLGKLRHPEDN